MTAFAELRPNKMIRHISYACHVSLQEQCHVSQIWSKLCKIQKEQDPCRPKNMHCWCMSVLCVIWLKQKQFQYKRWWRHQKETFSALLDICAGNSPVTSEFLAQRPVTRRFDVFFDLCLTKRLSKQSRCWWFETPSRSLWRHCNGSDERTFF